MIQVRQNIWVIVLAVRITHQNKTHNIFLLVYMIWYKQITVEGPIQSVSQQSKSPYIDNPGTASDVS